MKPLPAPCEALMLTSRQKTDRHHEQISRVRRICAALPSTCEKLSHGEPTFCVNEKVFATFANNHHHDGHVAVWIPAVPGVQKALIRSSSSKFFRPPPYVGVRGWVGIELDQISNDELTFHLLKAWRLTASSEFQTASGTANLASKSA
jgi:hypothetical protein